MALEQGGRRESAEGGIMRAQKNSMTLGDMAKGYERTVDEILSTAAGTAVRREVQICMNPVLESEGEEQFAALQKLLKRLEPYRKIFADVPEDRDERTAFALALVQREKSLQ